jgi:hypothetical protein
VSWNFCILRVANEHEKKAWTTAIYEQIGYANEHDADPPLMAKEYSMNGGIPMDDDDDIFSEGEEEKIFSSPEPEREDKALNFDNRLVKDQDRDDAQLSGSPPNIVLETRRDSPGSKEISQKKRSKKNGSSRGIKVISLNN